MKFDKLFSIKNENYRKVISILGLKLKFKKNKIKELENCIKLQGIRLDNLYQQIDCLKQTMEDISNAQIKKNIFDNIKLNTFNKNRLIITTGLISLINIMAILSSKENDDYDNHLIIYSAQISNFFQKYNCKIILSGYFQSITFVDEMNLKYINDESFICKFDEIYSVAHSSLKQFYVDNISLFEEGISSYFPCDEIDYSKVKNIYLSNYCGTVGYTDKTQSNKIIPIDKAMVKNVIKKVIQKNNLDFSYLKNENQILFLSQYIFQDFMTDEEVIALYKKHIDRLLDNGFSVLYKSHPRVNDTITNKIAEVYSNNTKFQFVPVEIKWPIELIILTLNIKAIVVSMSGAGFSCAHIFDIPCYGFGANIIKNNHPLTTVRKYSDMYLGYIKHDSLLINEVKIYG